MPRMLVGIGSGDVAPFLEGNWFRFGLVALDEGLEGLVRLALALRLRMVKGGMAVAGEA